MVASVCYSAGWVVELLVFSRDRARSGRAGSALLPIGVAFSVLVTIAPALLSVLSLMMQAIF